MEVICRDCGNQAHFTLSKWRCSCGGAWEPNIKESFDKNLIYGEEYSIWRYGRFLGLDIDAPLKRMGVGWTPLVPNHLFNRNIFLKLEFLSPTGSFKDRGVNAMVNQLVHMGVKSVVEDSSGNAGASLAAHAARFDIPAQIFVPDYTSPAKIKQIAVYGVEVLSIKGSRKSVERAAQESVGAEIVYASHAYNPAYLAGQMTAAFELWEQLDRKAPEWIVCPVAQGGQFLGYWLGFNKLLQAGLVDHLPRLVAVQSARIAPLFRAWSQGMDDVQEVDPGRRTVAEGVAISKPVRGKRLLQAVYESNGRVLAMREEEILESQMILSHQGYYVEPTSALALAGYHQIMNDIREKDIVVLPMTGSGLKGVPRINQR